ncbi:MAG: hypothetical protein ACJ8BW_19995 [Ktedonobacteraceae bacterium]
MYTIDLATILQLLQEFRRNGILQAELPSGVPGIREPCQALIELAEGKVVFCHIKNANGRTVLASEDALNVLNGLGTLNWLFTERQEPPASGLRDSSMSVPVVRPMAYAPSLIPRRILHVGQEDLNAWPRKYRRVFVLIDGERSAEKIAAILSLPPGGVEEVLEVLRKLKAMGIIAVE